MQIDESSNELVKLRNQLTTCIECCNLYATIMMIDMIENPLKELFNEIEEIPKRINELTKK